MPNDKLPAKEAALLAQARAELAKNPRAHAHAAAAPGSQAAQRDTAPRAAGGSIAGANGTAPAGVIQIVTLGGAARAPATDPARRAAALMAAARAESERKRLRWRRLYVWVPLAFMSAVGLWTLLWMWH